jgi:hypothetical protein
MKKRVLVVAPHPDDETLGAGGTIAKFVQQGHEVSVLVVSGHLPPIYSREDYDVTIIEAASWVSLNHGSLRFPPLWWASSRLVFSMGRSRE